MKEVEGIGKNIEQAIENALFELKAPREDVDIKIISEGGLFKKAKVIVSISEDVKEKYEKKEEKRKSFIEDEDGICIKKSKEEDKELKKVEKEKEKEEKKAEKQQEKEEKKKEKEEKDIKHINPKDFLQGLFNSYQKEITIEEIEDEKTITYLVKGENIGEMIGYRGETLFAISYLTSILAKKSEKKVLVDIEGYREKRIASLTALANKMASKVAKTGRYVKLEPMDAGERRIIHLALQDNPKVTTLSKGTEPHRFLMIFPREYKDS